MSDRERRGLSPKPQRTLVLDDNPQHQSLRWIKLIGAALLVMVQVDTLRGY